MIKFKAIEGSNTGHCCFKGSVIDLSAGVTDEYGETDYATVAEAFKFQDAVMIAKALNETVKG